MTAIPGDHDVAALVLICDHCGRTHERAHRAVEAWEPLWQQAVTIGWRGRDRAIGPHFCFRCAG